VNGQKYNLIGLTSIEGEHHNIRYKTYTSKSRDEWYEYDGRLVRVVDSKYIEKLCALVLYYQKAGK
jgi:ubiquitin C-terminal hydrolase